MPRGRQASAMVVFLLALGVVGIMRVATGGGDQDQVELQLMVITANLQEF